MIQDLKTQRLQIKEAKALIKKYATREDILDIQFGFKNVKGQSTGQLSIRFLVPKKLPAGRINRQEKIPKKIGRFYTDIVDHKIKRQTLRRVDPHDNVSPLIGGIEIQSSLYNQRSDWGTLGCIIRLNGQPYGITNYHVAFGNLSESQVETHLNNLRIFQPNRPNGGTPVGKPNLLFSSKLDYSVFNVHTAVDEEQDLNNIPGIIGESMYPRVGMIVGKTGAATGFTLGKIDALSIADPSQISIKYESSNANDSPTISKPGDSGSIWATGDKHWVYPVALHFGGDTRQNVAYARSFISVIKSIQSKLQS